MAKRRTFLVKVEVESNELDAFSIEEEIRLGLGRKVVRMINAQEEN